MRTTLDLDEDIFRAAKDLARERNQTLGKTVSELTRRGLRPAAQPQPQRRGLPVLPRKPGAKPVTSEMVKALLEATD
jgi:hypothetical protein